MSPPQDLQDTTTSATFESNLAVYPSRPDAENRYYLITVGKEPGVYQGMCVFTTLHQLILTTVKGGLVRPDRRGVW